MVRGEGPICSAKLVTDICGRRRLAERHVTTSVSPFALWLSIRSINELYSV